jgi:hypothetical protein
MIGVLSFLFPTLPDLTAWARARGRGWLVPLMLLAAGGALLVRLALRPADTLARLRRGRSLALQRRRRQRLERETDSLYPLW